jgi:hypothetical protein
MAVPENKHRITISMSVEIVDTVSLSGSLRRYEPGMITENGKWREQQ